MDETVELMVESDLARYVGMQTTPSNIQFSVHCAMHAMRTAHHHRHSIALD